ncbi:MAG: hypothetical protein ACO4BZ_06315 [Ilumatobacteraceae bacterium]
MDEQQHLGGVPVAHVDVDASGLGEHVDDRLHQIFPSAGVEGERCSATARCVGGGR